jgi:hypothetical protein
MNSRPIALRLASGSVTPARAAGSARRRRRPQLHAGRGDEVLLDLLGLALAQQAVVDEDAGQLVADRALHERRRHRGVDPAGQPADHPLVTDLRADRATASSTMLTIVQVGPAAGGLEQEALQHLLAVLAVQHLGVELHAVQPAAGVLERRHRRLRRRAVTRKPAGACTTASPCDIHTDCCAGSPLNSTPGSTTSSGVPPNSAVPVRSTRPPSEAAMAWKP